MQNNVETATAAASRAPVQASEASGNLEVYRPWGIKSDSLGLQYGNKGM